MIKFNEFSYIFMQILNYCKFWYARIWRQNWKQNEITHTRHWIIVLLPTNLYVKQQLAEMVSRGITILIKCKREYVLRKMTLFGPIWKKTDDLGIRIILFSFSYFLNTPFRIDLDQVRLSRVRGIGRARCNNAGKFEGGDGLGSPASAPNLPTRFSVGNAS
jgi:hypothetical protein